MKETKKVLLFTVSRERFNAIESMLSDMGYGVIKKWNNLEERNALKKLQSLGRSRPPDIFIFDYHLPVRLRTDGQKIFHSIKDKFFPKEMRPVIFLVDFQSGDDPIIYNGIRTVKWNEYSDSQTVLPILKKTICEVQMVAPSKN